MKLIHTTCVLLACMCFITGAYAQVPEKEAPKPQPEYDIVVEDSSLYQSDYSRDTSTAGTRIKKYATNKVQGLSPNKLITLGYDYQGSFDIRSTDDRNIGIGEGAGRVGANHGLRLSANFPIVSRNTVVLNLAVSYLESRYDYANRGTPDYPLNSKLADNPLRSTGLSLQLFKPLNEKHFILTLLGAELNGDYSLNTLPGLRYLKPTGIVAFGWKRNDRSMLAVGGGYVWRGGGPLIVPVLLFNHTFNRHWGLEMLLPARAHVRYNWSPRTLTLAGVELEGGSYVVRFDNAPFNAALAQSPNLELRKSELRFRLILERELYNFIWFSVQAGWRYNFQFNVAETANAPSANTLLTRGGQNVISNALANPLYVNLSLHLVSF